MRRTNRCRLVIFLLVFQFGCGVIGQSIYGWTETSNDSRRGRQKIRITSNPDGAAVKREFRGVRSKDASDVIRKAPFVEVVPYDVGIRTKTPASSWPLWTGLAAAMAGGLAVASNDEVSGLPFFIVSGVVDLLGGFIQLSRESSRDEQPRSVVLKYTATLEDNREQTKKIVIPSASGRLHFDFKVRKKEKKKRPRRQRKDLPTVVGDLQIIGPRTVRVWLNNNELSFDEDGGIFVGDIQAGVHKIKARADGYEPVIHNVVVRPDRTTMVKISQLGLNSKILASLDQIQMPRHSCTLVLRSAKAFPPVTYEIVHRTPNLSDSVNKALQGELPVEIRDFAVGTFEVIFRRGNQRLRKEITAKDGEEINLRANFSTGEIRTKVFKKR